MLCLERRNLELLGVAGSGTERLSTIEASTFTIGRGEGFGRHAHEDHQLVWASSGVVRVEAGDATWVVGPTVGVWVPGGVDHDVSADGLAQVHCLYFWPGWCRLDWDVATTFAVTPLVAELVGLLGQDGSPARLARAEALLFDLIEPVAACPAGLSSPADARAREVADALRADPRDDRTLAQWGRVVGANQRTLSRHFLADTGLTFAEWRTRLRMERAAEHLAAGDPVATAARRVGYASASAFVAAFHRAVGTTPAAAYPARRRGAALPARRPDECA